MSIKKFKERFKSNWQQFIKEGKDCVKEFKNPATRYKQIPNLLTASRLLSPFFILPAALTGNLVLTSIFVAGFALTDAVDGFLARRFNSASEFGRKLDALTDKIFAGTLLIPLIFSNPTLITLLIMEGAISMVNVNSQLRDNSPKTEMIGKVKTGALSVSILVNYINLIAPIPSLIVHLITTATVSLQISTLAKYCYVYTTKEVQKHHLNEVQNPVEITQDEDNSLDKVKVMEITTDVIDNEKDKVEELTVEEKIQQLKEIKEQAQYQEEPEEEKQKKIGGIN